MSVLRGVMIGIVVLVISAVVIGYLLPGSARVERSIVVDRPPATVFAVLNGFRHLPDWSPWVQLDPAMTSTYSGPIAGVGARYAWSSDQGAVGAGSQEIIESVPLESVVVRLEFSGMDSQNVARFDLKPEGAGTRVNWTLDSQFGASLLGRWFGLMLDTMVGPDYERGLAQLKAYVETLPAVDFTDITVETVDVPAQDIAYLVGSSSTEPAAIARAYEKAYAQLSSALAREGIERSGPPLAIGRRWDEKSKRYEFEAAIPVPAGTTGLRTDREIRIGKTYAGTALKVAHRGAEGTHLPKLMAYKQAVGWESNGAPWDVYLSAADALIETYVPVK